MNVSFNFKRNNQKNVHMYVYKFLLIEKFFKLNFSNVLAKNVMTSEHPFVLRCRNSKRGSTNKGRQTTKFNL